jgi:hypothetical protein
MNLNSYFTHSGDAVTTRHFGITGTPTTAQTPGTDQQVVRESHKFIEIFPSKQKLYPHPPRFPRWHPS